MEELNNTTELAEVGTDMVATSNNGGFWKGVCISAAVTCGGVAVYHFGKKLIKKIKANKAEKAEEPVEAKAIEPEK